MHIYYMNIHIQTHIYVCVHGASVNLYAYITYIFLFACVWGGLLS